MWFLSWLSCNNPILLIQLIQLEKLGFSLSRFQFQKRSVFFILTVTWINSQWIGHGKMDLEPPWSSWENRWFPVSMFPTRKANPLRRSQKDNLLAADRADRFGSSIFWSFPQWFSAHMFKMFEDLWHSIILIFMAASENVFYTPSYSNYMKDVGDSR